MKAVIHKCLNLIGCDIHRLPPQPDPATFQCQQLLNSLPCIGIEEILKDRKAAIKLTVQKYEDGMMPVEDAIVLLSTLVAENPKEVLEIGTFMGHTTKAMAENLPDATVHTMDLPLDFSAEPKSDDLIPKDDFHLIGRRIVGREFKGSPFEKQIVQHFGDTAKYDFHQIGHPTFFFIDGSHTYEYCKNDTEKCLDLCPRGGTFFWHDCDVIHPGVVRFLCEWKKAGHHVSRIPGTHLAYWKSPE